MKKKISSKLILGKRSVATLSEESMSVMEGGKYTWIDATCGACYPLSIATCASHGVGGTWCG
jgi:hypothetical protein